MIPEPHVRTNELEFHTQEDQWVNFRLMLDGRLQIAVNEFNYKDPDNYDTKDADIEFTPEQTVEFIGILQAWIEQLPSGKTQING